MKGGFVHRRHDEVRDLFTSLLKDVCHNVEVEPHLRFRPSQETFLPAVPTPLIKLAWISVRSVFGKGGNVHFSMSGFLTLSQMLSRAMRMRKSDTATGEILKWSMAPSALSCSHLMEEIAEKPNDFSLN